MKTAGSFSFVAVVRGALLKQPSVRLEPGRFIRLLVMWRFGKARHQPTGVG